MPILDRAVVLALTFVVATVAGSAGMAQAPVISKPKAAPRDAPNMPSLPPAVIDNQLKIGGDDIKARQVDTRMTVEVQVNGRGPYHFVVDSGADTSVVGLNLARALQLPLGRPVLMNSMTDRNIVDRVKVAALTVGPSTVADLEVPALREQDLGGDGMIGIDALVRQRLMMDFETRTIKVEDAAKPISYGRDVIVITAKLLHGQLILTQVKANGVALDAVIDTGSEITIGNLALRDKLIRRRAKQDWTVATTGVSGKTVDLQLAALQQLQLGSVTLRDIPIAFADVPPFKVFGMADQPALLIGTDLLETFRRISLDFRARKVRFQLRHCGTVGIDITTNPTSGSSRLSSGSDQSTCER